MTEVLSEVGEAARRGDPTRFEAALFASQEMRERLFVLIALNLELARIPQSVSEPMLGEIRLQWWAEAVEDLFDGGDGGRHHILLALRELVSAGVLNKAHLLELIDARRMGLEGADVSVDEFLSGTAGVLAALEVGALGGGANAQAVAADAGWAEGASRLIGAFPAIAAEGGAPLPDMAPADRAALASGELPDALRRSARDLAEKGLARLSDARRRRADVPRSARAPLLSVHVEEPRLRMIAAGGDPMTEDWRPSPFRARLRLFGRALTGRF